MDVRFHFHIIGQKNHPKGIVNLVFEIVIDVYTFRK